MFKVVAIACLLGVAMAAPSYPLGGYLDSYSVPNYGFNYAVNDPHTGDSKAQSEHRTGDYVKGSYSLAEPDGTLRVVDYTAGPHTGFNAVVKRLGPAVHQQYLAPIVQKPIAPILAPVNLAGVGYWGNGWNQGLHGSWGLGGLGGWGGIGLNHGWAGQGWAGHGLGQGWAGH